MARYRCKACEAEYTDVLPDGSRYYHACAPINNPAWQAQFTVDENGNMVPRGPINPNIPPMVEHPQKRDENVEKKPTGNMGPKKDPPGKDPVL